MLACSPPPNTLPPAPSPPLLPHITYYLPSPCHRTQRGQDAHPHKGRLEQLGLVAEAWRFEGGEDEEGW